MNELSSWQYDGQVCYVHKALLRSGISPTCIGYKYLSEAILMLFEDEDSIDGITKIIYPKIARKNHSTASSVERAMRCAIEKAWDTLDSSITRKYYPYRQTRPTNKEFVANTYFAIKIAMNAQIYENFTT